MLVPPLRYYRLTAADQPTRLTDTAPRAARGET
jgi:hypothetical protein